MITDDERRKMVDEKEKLNFNYHIDDFVHRDGCHLGDQDEKIKIDWSYNRIRKRP